jgi:hypothetical protein
VAARVGFCQKLTHPEVLVCFNIFAFLRACRLNRLCARFLGFSGWWVSFGVLHASVQVIVDCTGLNMACVNDFKADLYGLTALSISVARNALLEQWPARIGNFSGLKWKIGNLIRCISDVG